MRLLLIVLILTGINILNSINLKIYTEELAPLNFINDQNQIDGFSTDIVKAIQNKIGDNTPVELVQWNEIYSEIIKGDVPYIMLYSTTFTEERRDLFHWVGPVFDNSWKFFALKSRNIKIKNFDDLKLNYIIGTYFEDAREQYLQKENFLRIDSVPRPELNLRKLLAGRIDLWISSEAELRSVAEKEDVDIDLFESVYTAKEVGLFIVFSRSTPESYVQIWQKAYNELKNESTLNKISNKWGYSVPVYKIPVRK